MARILHVKSWHDSCMGAQELARLLHGSKKYANGPVGTEIAWEHNSWHDSCMAQWVRKSETRVAQRVPLGIA